MHAAQCLRFSPSLHIRCLPTHLYPISTPTPRVQLRVTDRRPRRGGHFAPRTTTAHRKLCVAPSKMLCAGEPRELRPVRAPPTGAGPGLPWACLRLWRPRPWAGPGRRARPRSCQARRWLLLRFSWAPGTVPIAGGTPLCPAPGVRDGRCAPRSIVSLLWLFRAGVRSGARGPHVPSGGWNSKTRGRRRGVPGLGRT